MNFAPYAPCMFTPLAIIATLGAENHASVDTKSTFLLREYDSYNCSTNPFTTFREELQTKNALVPTSRDVDLAGWSCSISLRAHIARVERI